MSNGAEHLAATDPEIHAVLVAEEARQTDGLELIASENFTSRAVLEATGSVLMNKYAEGLPGKRYYAGCEHVDVAENLARDRAKRLFGAEHANVQPHSGAQANMAAYFTLLDAGDKILGMDLSNGGHLTHGARVNFSGQLFDPVFYGIGEQDGLIDYDVVRDVARRERPRLIVAGASAYPRVIDFGAFAEIAREIDAFLLVDMAHIAGLVATGHHPSPVPHADVVTSTTHKTLRGPRGGLILCREEHAKGIDKSVFPFMQGGPLMHVVAAKAVAFREALSDEFSTYSGQVIANAQVLGGAGITVNKNTVPGESRSPFVTSGLRLGTPALTARGMAEAEMIRIADWIEHVLAAPSDADRIVKVRNEVRELASSFSLYHEVVPS